MDDTLYASRGAVLLFVPAGFALAAYHDAISHAPRRHDPAWSWALTAAVAVSALVSIAVPSVRSAWHANLGALQQAKVELAGLDRNRLDSPTVDQVRARAMLDPAVSRFRAALASRPDNATAIRRLAAIQLARGEYDEAARTVARHGDGGADDYAMRAVSGDVMVANARIDEAASLLRNDPLAVDRLLSIAWYRYWIAGDRTRAADAWRTVLKLDPGRSSAVEWLNIATTRPDWINR